MTPTRVVERLLRRLVPDGECIGARTISIRPSTPLDATESRRRSPSSPGVLVGAVGVREHQTPGKLLAVKRLPKRET